MTTPTPTPGPEHPDWPWVSPNGPPTTMPGPKWRRWRKLSEALRRGHAKRLGRRLTGRELIDLCDRPAALVVLGLTMPDPEPKPREKHERINGSPRIRTTRATPR